MTNAVRFKTAEERTKEFRRFCKDMLCSECPCKGTMDDGTIVRCVLDWLELEYKETELNPCPFCGHTDIRMSKNSAGDVWHIYCNGCGCRTGGDVVKDMAISTWNRRGNA